MAEDSGKGYDGEDRRTGDRLHGQDRRQSKRGIRGLFPFSLLLDRRRGKDRRSDTDRRGGSTADDTPEASR